MRNYIEPQMTLCLGDVGVRSITNCGNGVYRLGGKECQKDKLPPSRGLIKYHLGLADEIG